MQQSTVWLLLIFAAGLSFLPAVAGATAPAASFTSNITSGTTIPFPVQFIDTSGNVPISWTWSFGDGGTSTAQDPPHTYTASGTYTVTLTTTNADGSDTETKTGYITISKSTTAPAAAFISNTTTGTNPLAVQFVDASSNSPTAWAWSFGDGGTSSVQNPVHTYSREGRLYGHPLGSQCCGQFHGLEGCVCHGDIVVIGPRGIVQVDRFVR